MSRYRDFNLDQCHTAATAYGNAIKAINELIGRHNSRALNEYLLRCQEDNERELSLVNERIIDIVANG